MTRKTIVLPNRYALHMARFDAARNHDHGYLHATLDQAIARLGGGFTIPVSLEALATSIRSAMQEDLGELNEIKDLQGFQDALLRSLQSAWNAGLDFPALRAKATSTSQKTRLDSFNKIEELVHKNVPPNMHPLPQLIEKALARVEHASQIFGSIELRGFTDLSPIYQSFVTKLADALQVKWIAHDEDSPPWIKETSISVSTNQPIHTARDTRKYFSCATPGHEVVEALRWVRSRLANGIQPDQIAIATTSTTEWDDHVLAAAKASNLPLHFIHGESVLATTAGQLAAALADILISGISRRRMIRLISTLKSESKDFGSIRTTWHYKLPDVALHDTEEWLNQIGTLKTECESEDEPQWTQIEQIVETLARGIDSALEIGAKLLQDRSLSIWRRALILGSPLMLEETLSQMRVENQQLSAATSVVWGPASLLAAYPRPYTWLLGLTSNNWPRRPREDPLLPNHVVDDRVLQPTTIRELDRREFRILERNASEELILSFPRHDIEGKRHGHSPFFETKKQKHLRETQIPKHAFSSSDRYFARIREFNRLERAKSCKQLWNDWTKLSITEHEGVFQRRHPLLLETLDRVQSASSLRKLLTDPLGYVWQYGFGWKDPGEYEEGLDLNPLDMGNLLHEVLAEVVETTGGLEVVHSLEGITIENEFIESALKRVIETWESENVVPPPLIWSFRCEEIRNFVYEVLSLNPTEPGARSYAEVPFGGESSEADARKITNLPWDPEERVVIPNTGVAIRGRIDRLDLWTREQKASVIDYKTGKVPNPMVIGLDGGRELQRCLYAYAVQSLLGEDVEITARLLYVRSPEQDHTLRNADDTLTRLSGYITHVVELIQEGRVVPGIGTIDGYNDHAFALPTSLALNLLNKKLERLRTVEETLSLLWLES